MGTKLMLSINSFQSAFRKQFIVRRGVSSVKKPPKDLNSGIKRVIFKKNARKVKKDLSVNKKAPIFAPPTKKREVL